MSIHSVLVMRVGCQLQHTPQEATHYCRFYGLSSDWVHSGQNGMCRPVKFSRVCGVIPTWDEERRMDETFFTVILMGGCHVAACTTHCFLTVVMLIFTIWQICGCALVKMYNGNKSDGRH